MTCPGLCAAWSWSDRWSIKLILCFEQMWKTVCVLYVGCTSANIQYLLSQRNAAFHGPWWIILYVCKSRCTEVQVCAKNEWTKSYGTTCVCACVCVSPLSASAIFLCIWSKRFLARLVILLIALCGHVKGRQTVLLGPRLKGKTEWKRAKFSFAFSLLLLVCLHSITLPPLLKRNGCSCRPGHSCVQHRIDTELIMRRGQTKCEWERW